MSALVVTLEVTYSSCNDEGTGHTVTGDLPLWALTMNVGTLLTTRPTHHSAGLRM